MVKESSVEVTYSGNGETRAFVNDEPISIVARSEHTPLTYQMYITGPSDSLVDGMECIIQTVMGPNAEPLYVLGSCFNEQRGIVRSCIMNLDEEEE